MDTKLIIGAAAVAIGAIWLFRKKNQDKNNNKAEEHATENLNDLPTQQALKLRNLLEPKQALITRKWGSWTFDASTPIGQSDRVEKEGQLYNICLEITDWPEVQKKFGKLLNNEATLLQILETIPDRIYKNCLDFIKANKVITTTATSAQISKYDPNGKALFTDQTVQFTEGQIVGAYSGTVNGIVAFVNGFQSDGGIFEPELERFTGRIPQNKVKIVNPNK